MNFFINVFTFYSAIFTIFYFLNLEKQKGIPNELSEESSSNISQYELNLKNYIEQYKSQYPREGIKNAIINSGVSQEDAENYLNKYY